ncbi:class I SAM-dependent methyltransferase [Streptomyces kanamyceticus]|uniref:Class I SAM-dependent methyltransferase n=1 Tax=Streptomyces kanamyceticus TaxID=1967 RepID=A0A5J6GA15_STRKN|nr:class I SAM-dependent methyltransferase [Streptomyces kanamyceticus]QEU90671.1 class I SAM-dependent methyltransferase [Streptomyces kanamyceticus]
MKPSTTTVASTANARQEEIWNGPLGHHWAEQQDRYDAMSAALNDRLFEAAAIRNGDRVLDIGCGAGTVTRTAARLAGLGHAVGVDISAPLLDRARARARDERVRNVAFERADAQTHPFPVAGYDVAISRGGVMFFADHAAAFDNIARALIPGGRLVFACPQPAGSGGEEAQALGLLSKLLGEGEGEGETDGEGRGDNGTSDARAAMASLSDPDHIRRSLAAYDDVTVTPLPIETHWGQTPADAVDFLLSRTPDRTVSPAVRTGLEDALRPYATAAGVRMRAAVWLVTAVRPRT